MDGFGRYDEHGLRRSLATWVERATHGGWSPRDLAELVTRQLSARHLPLLAALLGAALAAADPRTVAPAWRAELDSLGRGTHPPLSTPGGFGLGLALERLLATLPSIPALIPPPGAAGAQLAGAAAPPGSTEGKVLAKVRALLAKAESTDFPEEAEALSAKAQKLISRYSLDRLAASPAESRGTVPVARRLWLDPPYLVPKSMLVGAVAEANRCRAISTGTLPFVCLVGAAEDLDAVELLATSLLVQADVALLRAARGGAGAESRSAAYRRAFLLAYAQRIGERLTEADRQQVHQSGAGLVPVLRRHEERVTAKTRELFPRVVSRQVRFSNRNGWVQGRAAADRAELGHADQLTS